MVDFSQSTVLIGRQDNQTGTVHLLGTAFLIDDIHIVTCFHVVGGNDEGLCFVFPQTRNIDEYQDTTDTSCKIHPLKIKYPDPITDLCILESTRNAHLVTDSYWQLGSLDDAHVGETIGLWGFPHCTHGRRVLTFQQTELGAKMLQTTHELKRKYGIVNIQTRPGQSGSPVYSLDSKKVIGVLVGSYARSNGISLGGINPFELHQTSYCISAEYIKQMLK